MKARGIKSFAKDNNNKCASCSNNSSSNNKSCGICSKTVGSAS